jgi:hypothetical protein
VPWDRNSHSAALQTDPAPPPTARKAAVSPAEAPSAAAAEGNEAPPANRHQPANLPAGGVSYMKNTDPTPSAAGQAARMRKTRPPPRADQRSRRPHLPDRFVIRSLFLGRHGRSCQRNSTFPFVVLSPFCRASLGGSRRQRNFFLGFGAQNCLFRR